jgi:hypothetical protein
MARLRLVGSIGTGALTLLALFAGEYRARHRLLRDSRAHSVPLLNY